jgi:hypothetical protein
MSAKVNKEEKNGKSLEGRKSLIVADLRYTAADLDHIWKLKVAA